jgi:hypothetical protein
MASPLDEARAKMKEALRAFEVLSARAIAVAADPKASRTAIDDARTQATFALAAVGAAFKKSLHAARPSDGDV